MWTAKHKEERKEEFIVSAIELFTEQGYEQTSLNHILKKMTITKGSFYHNFESKSDLLNHVIDYMAYGIQEIIERLTQDKSLSSLDKLRELSKGMVSFRHKNAKVYDAIVAFQKDDKNAYMSQLFTKRIIEIIHQRFQRIIDEGRSQGTFNLIDPYHSTKAYIDCMLMYKRAVIDIYLNNEMSDDKKTISLKAVEEIYRKIISGILGIKPIEVDYLSATK
jgi:AcrR family transcriptional regulator